MTYDLSGIHVEGKALPMSRGAIQNYGFFHPDTIEGYEDEGNTLLLRSLH
jgi:hypothetical protein